MAKITFDDISLTLAAGNDDHQTILNNLSLALTEQRIGIIGANGSGKSSLVRCINGLTTVTNGTVYVDGLNPAKNKQAKQIRQKIGFLFSNADSQIIMPTVAEDVAFSLRRHRLSRQEKQRIVTRALERVGLAGRGDQSPHTLSGGEKQLLALASILVVDPATIIADEPTTLLDLRNRRKMKTLFKELDQQLIVVTHDLELIAEFDRVICLNEGTVVEDSANTGTVDSVINNYERRMQ